MLASSEFDPDEETSPDHAEENTADPTLAAIHVGRRVPVYRKLGDFNSKRVREIIMLMARLGKHSQSCLGSSSASKLIGRASHARNPLPSGGSM
jgi:hypothetical protein